MNAQTISTMEGKPLPDKYAKLARAPGIPDTGRLRLFLQGKVGSGKTFFACSWPRTAVLDCENKTSAVRRRGPGTEIFQFKTAKEYDDLIEMLVADGMAGQAAFDTIAIDTVLAFRDLRRRAITAEYRSLKKLKGPGDITDYKSEGAGWSILNADVNNTFERLYQAGYGWIALAHVVPKWRESGGNSVCSWDSVLNAGVLDYLHGQCEYCAFFERRTDTVKRTGPARKVTAEGVGSRTMPGIVTEERISRYQLCFLPPDPRLPVREHIPLEQEVIDIPEGGGHTAFATLYHEAGRRWLADVEQEKTDV